MEESPAVRGFTSFSRATTVKMNCNKYAAVSSVGTIRMESI